MEAKQTFNKFLSFVWEMVKIVAVAALIVIPIRYFLFQPFLVRGQSMEPNFRDGDYLIVDELSYRLREPQRGEVIVFKYPENPSQRFIKRIIALPGEILKIEEGKIKIFTKEGVRVLDEEDYLPNLETLGGIEITLEQDEYFVLGDNRNYSFDSRRFGPLEEENIIGRVFLRAWPPESINKFEMPSY